MIRVARTVLLVAALGQLALFVYVVASRIGFPYAMDWMAGSMLDHADRARAGLPIYTAPTTRWIPYLYPPLLYWLTAALGVSFVTCRSISLVACSVQAACVWRLARREGATRYWSTIGVLLFVAAFFYAGYSYDNERTDTLCVALILVATVLLIEWTTVAGSTIAGIVLGLAFFAKQQALPFVGAAALALAVDRRWVRAATLIAGSALLIGALSYWQNTVTGGWFGYYVFRMPLSHGINLRLWRSILAYDVWQGAIIILGTVGLCASALAEARRGDRRHLTFALMLCTGALVALASRLHIGGWVNVLQPWTSFACPALAILASRVEQRLERRKATDVRIAAVYAIVLAQLLLWLRTSRNWVPDRKLRASAEAFVAHVRDLEQRGEVLVVGQGHITKSPHFQMSGLADVARMNGVPPDLLADLRARRLAAIVDDARVQGGPEVGLWPPIMIEDVPAARAPLFANYYVAESLDGHEMRIAPAFSRWVYLPRSSPLDERDPDLARRHFAEMGLAARHTPAVTIEELARQENERGSRP